jgi:hypothetical protein
MTYPLVTSAGWGRRLGLINLNDGGAAEARAAVDASGFDVPAAVLK